MSPLVPAGAITRIETTRRALESGAHGAALSHLCSSQVGSWCDDFMKGFCVIIPKLLGKNLLEISSKALVVRDGLSKIIRARKG